MARARLGAAARRAVVLVFGESINDSKSVEHLLVAANPHLAGRVRARPTPTSLTRHARLPAVRNWIGELRNVVRATQATGVPVAAVVVHRDADGPDLRGQVAADLTQQLAELDGKAVVPVQAIEAWWFLFPDAVEAIRPGTWKGKLPRRGRDVETIDRPKDALQRATRTKNGLEYAESDSPVIAKHILDKALQPLCDCRSYGRLLTTAKAIPLS